jgi:predicted ATPase
MANAHGFRYRAAAASVLRGWALAAGGRPEQGIEILRDGLAGCRRTGAEMDRPYYLALLAEACWNAGRWEDGLHAVNEGLTIVRESRDSLPFFYEAELHRLKACLLLRQGGSEIEAEALLQRAQDVARQQQSSSLELRATVALVRLRRSARDAGAVGEIYHRSKEGFGTPDLIEAKELLHVHQPS